VLLLRPASKFTDNALKHPDAVDAEDVFATRLKVANMHLEPSVLFAARTRTAMFKY
jgi:hypothetical protein